MKATKEVTALVQAGLSKQVATNIAELVATVSDDLKPYLRLCATLAVGSDNPVWQEYAVAIVRGKVEE